MDVTLSPAKPDLVQVARVEEALSKLARQAARQSPDRRGRVLVSHFFAAKSVPTVDPTMRSVGGNNEQVSSVLKSLGGRTARTLPRILLIAGLGAAATLSLLSSWPPQSRESSVQPVVADARNGPATAEQESQATVHAIVEEATPQPSAAAHTTSDTMVSAATPAPSPTMIEQLQAMADDVASLRQRVEQLTAGQEQLGRTIAKLQAAERDARRRRTESQVVTPASKPLATLPPPQTQQLPSAPTPEAPPPRPPGSIR
jgi:hypothetical protein